MVSPQLIQDLMGASNGRPLSTKMRVDGYYYPVRLTVENGRILTEFGYNPSLQNEIKNCFEGREYHGFKPGDGRKLWSFPITYRNLFQLEHHMGKYGNDPYFPWTKGEDYTNAIKEHWEQVKKRCGREDIEIYQHQIEQINLALNGHWVIFAAEMGVGKTLAAMIAFEMSELYEPGNLLWVGTNSSLVSTQVEFRQWRSPLDPWLVTYTRMRKLVSEWPPGKDAPRLICFDEISRCKNPAAQQTKACKHTADSCRNEYGWDKSMILGLSGTPAPKTPADWWSVCEVVCPGFIKERDYYTFRNRLGYYVEQENPTGGTYQKLVAWKDGEDKCRLCGKPKDDPAHHLAGMDMNYHQFEKGVNEVAKLKKRLSGLVGVWLKKDCLDLPEKRYETHRCTPSQEILNAARLAVKTSRRTVDALIRLRTISDGFIYQDRPTGIMYPCNACYGSGKVSEPCDLNNPDDPLLPEEIKGKFRYIYTKPGPDDDPITFIPSVIGQKDAEIGYRDIECFICSGKGEIERTERSVVEVPCPKLDVHKRLLEEHEEGGRFVTYAGFQGSIDRLTEFSLQYNWFVCRADGRGWKLSSPTGEDLHYTRSEMLEEFQSGKNFDKMLFLGQPGAAGMGLTLTASPSIFFYSNDFVPENRQQAEDRGHRLSMDKERGGRIIDVFHLPIDEQVYESLRKSKMLQLMSLTGLTKIMEA